MFELIAVNVLWIFEKLHSRSRCQVLEQKDWKLGLEIKSNEYISVFPLIFQFPLSSLYSHKALINSTCNSGLYRIYKRSCCFFFQLITYHWSFVSYQNICIFIKWKHVKYHAERSKYPFYAGVEIFSFQPEVKGMRISKKIHPRVKFISPTYNMPLRFGLERSLDYFTEVRLVLRYTGLRLASKSLNWLTWLWLILL